MFHTPTNKLLSEGVSLAIGLVGLSVANYLLPFAPPWLPETVRSALPLLLCTTAVLLLVNQLMLFFRWKHRKDPNEPPGP